MSESESAAPLGYDFFADVEGTRSVAHTLEAGIRFQTLTNSLERLERTLSDLPSRLQLLHERGVSFRTSLGEEVARLTHRLDQAATQAREMIERYQGSLQPRVEALWAQIEANDEQIGADGYEPHAAAIAAAKLEGDTLKSRMESAEEAIHNCFSELGNEVRALEKRIAHLEKAIATLEGATFALRPGETLLDASEATYLPAAGERAQGGLFLTDQRLIFEQRETVTTKARFLPFSKSRRVDEVRFDRPLDQIEGGAVVQAEGGEALRVTLAGRGEAATFILRTRPQSWVRLIERARGGEIAAGN